MPMFHYYSRDNTVSYFVESQNMYHTVGSPLGCSCLGQFEGVLVEQYVYLPIYCRIDGGDEFQISGRNLLETFPLFATRGQFPWVAMQGDKIAFAEHLCQAEMESFPVSLRSYFLYASNSAGVVKKLFDPCLGCFTNYTVILEDKSTNRCFDVLCPVSQRKEAFTEKLLYEFDQCNHTLNLLVDEIPKDRAHLSWQNMEARGYKPLVSKARDPYEGASEASP